MIRPVALLACIVLVSAASADDKPAADLKAMVGKWKIEKAELGGMDILEHIKDMKFEITDGGKYTAQLGEEKDAGTFTVDPTKTPKEMDVKPTGGPAKGKTVKAIYKLDGDSLVICYEHDTEKGSRPTKFESKPDTTLLLITYKREKK